MRKLPDTREEFEDEISSLWREELKELSLELYDRIAELEKCCVMGGDGKPIGIGDERSGRNMGKIVTGPVAKITIVECCTPVVCINCEIEIDGMTISNHYLYSSELFSSPEDVPGGAE